MKILLLSDIHMNFTNKTYIIWRKFFQKKLKKQEFDCIVVAGDICSSKQRELDVFFSLLRSFCPDKEILWVRGNHDYWDKDSWVGKKSLDGHLIVTRNFTYQKMISYHKELSNKYNLILLDGDSFEMDEDHIFFGFDGWYGYEPITNDSAYMPPELRDHSLLRNKAHNDLNNILNKVEVKGSVKEDDRFKICITHFPSYTRNQSYRHMTANENYLGFICDNFDLLLIGHSHQDETWNFRKCLIVNCGSDYNNPKAKIIDTNTKFVETISYSNFSTKSKL
jgi:predicted phosphodiesterase